MNVFKRAFKNSALLAITTITLLLSLTGCQTAGPAKPLTEGSTKEDAIVLREGDQLKISFPSTPKLDTEQLIRRDGKVVLPSFGEVQAVGLTPAQLEKQILEQFGNQLVTKEVTVTLASSQFPVFVSGAVLRPGKIESQRPITALEAVMEAGGFNYATANLKAVKVIRTEGENVKTFLLDFRPVLKGEPSQPFYVKASDIIFVPEKFTLF